jgi:hypothetical protein
MSDTRKLVAAFIAVMGLGVVIFGVVRGLTSSGPGSGTRLIIAIAPPVDADVVKLAEHVVHDRLDETGVSEPRVVPAGDRIVAELADRDPQNVAMAVSLLERTGTLEVKAAGKTVLDGTGVKHAEIAADGGVLVDTVAPVSVQPGTPLEIVFDGKVHTTIAPDRVSPLHLPVTDARSAIDLVSLFDAGAAHPMHVVHSEAFTRATGFVPRAWPFFAIGAVFLLGAGIVARKR